MANGAFQDFIIWLDDMGVTDVILPFLLIFTVFFAILTKTKVLGEGKKNMNIAVSLVISMLVVIPHVTGAYPSDTVDPVVIISKALPNVSIIVIAVLMLLILVGMFGGEYKLMGAALSSWITFASIAIIVFIFGAAADWWGGWDWIEITFGPDALSMALILVIFGILVAFITSEPKEHHGPSEFKQDLKNIYTGGGGGGGGHH
jgi:hypothetical protein